MKKILLVLGLFIININVVLAESNAYLSSLSVSDYNLSPSFDKYNNTYSVTVDQNVTKLNIDYTLEDESSEVEILDNELITEENHTVTIKVTNNKESQIYKILVNKLEDQTVGSFTQDNIDLSISNKRNMKLVLGIIISLWIIAVLLIRRIMFGRLKKKY